MTPIVNVDDPTWSGEEEGGRWKRLGRMAGGADIGCTLEEIEPGGRPSPYHFHVGDEEALFVIAGEGELRTPTGTHTVRAGDYVAFPAGEAGAHAIENTSDDVLRCLFISTVTDPDVVVYPDAAEIHVRSAKGVRGTFPYPPPD